MKGGGVGLVGKVDSVLFVVKFALEVAFEFVASVGKFGFGSFLIVEFGE